MKWAIAGAVILVSVLIGLAHLAKRWEVPTVENAESSPIVFLDEYTQSPARDDAALRAFFDCLLAKEGGDYNLTEAFWQDAMAFAGKNWDYETHGHDKIRCEWVILWYFQRWCPQALLEGDWATLATAFRYGGPRTRYGMDVVRMMRARNTDGQSTERMRNEH